MTPDHFIFRTRIDSKNYVFKRSNFKITNDQSELYKQRCMQQTAKSQQPHTGRELTSWHPWSLLGRRNDTVVSETAPPQLHANECWAVRTMIMTGQWTVTRRAMTLLWRISSLLFTVAARLLSRFSLVTKTFANVVIHSVVCFSRDNEQTTNPIRSPRVVRLRVFTVLGWGQH